MMLDHEYATMRHVEDEHWWYQVLRSRVRRDLEKHANGSPAYAVLDAGCGTGGMLAHLQANGHPDWKLAGVDISPLGVAFCRERGLAGVQLGEAGKLPYLQADFNAALSLDVICCEGVDESQALAECARVIPPGGIVVLNLAAYDCLRGSHDVAVSAVRRYTPARVQKLLAAQGLQVLAVHGWNAWAFLPLLCWRFISRGFLPKDPQETKSDLFRLPRWIETLLARLTGIDMMLCRAFRFPLGTSIYALAVKPQPAGSAQAPPTHAAP